MHPFASAIELNTVKSGTYRAQVDSSWFQGRGAYGGVVSALLLRACEQVVADDGGVGRRPRSLTVHFCAPLKQDEAVIEVAIDRKGAWVTHLSGRLRQGGDNVATLTATFASPRPPEARLHFNDVVMPQAPAPAILEAIPADLPGIPQMTRHFEYRLAVGEVPYAGGEKAFLGSWLRLREPLVVDYAAAAAFLDALPPAVLCRVDGMRAAASVDWTVHFLDELPAAGVAADAFWLVTAQTQVASDGYAEEVDQLFSPDGRLVAQARQLIAIL